MSFDQLFLKEKEKYLGLLGDKNYNMDIIAKLVQSNNGQSWKILQTILITLEKNSRTQYDHALQVIQKSVRQISSFTMLMFIYSLKLRSKNYTFLYSASWKMRYITICLQNGDIMLFSAWISAEPKSQIVQETLTLVCDIFPNFFNKQRIDMTVFEISAIIQWIAFFEAPNHTEYSSILQLTKIIKQTHVKLDNDYTKKQHIILKKVIEVSSSSTIVSSNIFLFLYPFVLQEKDIAYFIHLNYQLLLELPEQSITNFFIALTKSAMSREIICLISKISNLLRVQDQFFKLRYIYQNFILPIFIKRAKSCLKLQGLVYQMAQFYILGFYKHCNLGKQGMQCIIRNIQKIKNVETQQKWLSICYLLIQRYPNQKQYVIRNLEKAFGKPVTLNEINKDLQDKDIVWEITQRSGRKHKKYCFISSTIKGIQNSGNDCYLITTVQALHKTGLLQNLLDEYRTEIKGRYSLLDQVRILFQQMSGIKPVNKINVMYLKNKGPQFFAESSHQQDVQQYMLQLFDQMEKKMQAIPGLLNKFKQIYESTIRIKIICKNCNKQLQKQERSYIYTIPNTQILSQKTTQKVACYMCQSCNSESTCKVQRKIILKGKILIVHINRFSHNKGIAKKQLSTQTILREFMGYRLKGIICHIGKNVENGHYLYYSQISEKRWAKFSDLEVYEFEFDQKDQQFERQTKAETTPYILIYRKMQ